jgi:hypothetical protein
MLATFAFDVCHDVYRAAREAIDSKIPTLNAEAAGKYQWRPDRLPRLAEYVCDFARAGEKALGAERGADFRFSGFAATAFGPILGEDRQAKVGSSRHGGGGYLMEGDRLKPVLLGAGLALRAMRSGQALRMIRSGQASWRCFEFTIWVGRNIRRLGGTWVSAS